MSRIFPSLTLLVILLLIFPLEAQASRGGGRRAAPGINRPATKEYATVDPSQVRVRRRYLVPTR